LERYKLLVDSVEDYAIFLLDPNGYIQTWNKGAQKNKGYTAADIIGKHFSTFYLERDVEAKKPERELELAKRLGRVEDEDWRLRKDGSKFWANVVITALHDKTGALVGFAKVTRDLTERKQHEDALRAANIQLQQQQRELEELNVSKDEFISLASHQLRTPATAIKQLLGILMEGFKGEVAPDQLALIAKAYESNERQINTVNNLLRVAHVDSGKLILRKTPVEVRRLLTGIIEGQTDTFKARHQTVSLDVSASLPDTLMLDNENFRMALENLLDNASKYTGRGGAITLAAERKNAEAIIAIHDNGVGIASEDMNKLFNKFSRIPNVLSQSVGGSGLGLYWVHKVISLHGGRIEVESEVDKGTIFRVCVPVNELYA